jgi:hypothetical protein
MSDPASNVPPPVQIEGFILRAGLSADHAHAEAIVRFEPTDAGRFRAIIEPVARQPRRPEYQPDGSMPITLGF